MNPSTDDWEPAIATDPIGSLRVRGLHAVRRTEALRREVPLPADHARASPTTAARPGARSVRSACAAAPAPRPTPRSRSCRDTGDVYAAWLNDGFNTVFASSTDHGKTWSDPVKTFGKVSWTDKPFLATERRRAGTCTSRGTARPAAMLYVAQSHDFGATWPDEARRHEALLLRVRRRGRARRERSTFSQSEPRPTPGPARAPEGSVQIHAITSTDAGRHWTNIVVDTVPVGEACDPAGGMQLRLLPRARGDRGRRATGTSRSCTTARRTDLGATADLGDGARPTAARRGRRPSRVSTLSTSRRGVHRRGRDRPRRRARVVHAAGRRPRRLERVVPARRPTAGLTWSSPVKLSDVTAGTGVHVRRAGSWSRTATTARSGSRTRGRRSRSGARG